VFYFTTQLQQFRGDVRQRASETVGDWIGSPACSLSFNVATPTPTDTPTPTATPSATPTATPPPECNSVCVDPEGSDCPDVLVCYIPNGEAEGNCRIESNLESEVCAEPTATPTNTPTETLSPTPIPACNDSCTSGDECPSGLVCYIVNEGEGYCRVSDNPGSETCSQPTVAATNTPSPTLAPDVTATNTPTPTTMVLPEAGISLPGLAVFGGGLIMAIVGILLAL